jgi:hypothetical protein
MISHPLLSNGLLLELQHSGFQLSCHNIIKEICTLKKCNVIIDYNVTQSVSTHKLSFGDVSQPLEALMTILVCFVNGMLKVEQTMAC